MEIQHDDTFKDKNQKDIALMILSPDDTHRKVAVDIAFDFNKTIIFELMIDMVKNFNDVCSSKMMIRNFDKMLSEGHKKVIEFFEKTQYSTLLMETQQYVVNWPQDLNSYTFAFDTSIVTKQQLEEEL